MAIRQDPSFLMQSSAIGISGWMRGEPIEALAVAALPLSVGRSDRSPELAARLVTNYPSTKA